MIAERLRRETEPQRLVLLANALLWDYQAADWLVIAEADVFRTLAGTWDGAPQFNPLATAWGKEQNYYSIENMETNVDISQS